jgi:hypothetical protein
LADQQLATDPTFYLARPPSTRRYEFPLLHLGGTLLHGVEAPFDNRTIELPEECKHEQEIQDIDRRSTGGLCGGPWGAAVMAERELADYSRVAARALASCHGSRSVMQISHELHTSFDRASVARTDAALVRIDQHRYALFDGHLEALERGSVKVRLSRVREEALR